MDPRHLQAEQRQQQQRQQQHPPYVYHQHNPHYNPQQHHDPHAPNHDPNPEVTPERVPLLVPAPAQVPPPPPYAVYGDQSSSATASGPLQLPPLPTRANPNNPRGSPNPPPSIVRSSSPNNLNGNNPPFRASSPNDLNNGNPPFRDSSPPINPPPHASVGGGYSPNPPPPPPSRSRGYSPNPPSSTKKSASSRHHHHWRTRSVDYQPQQYQHQQSPQQSPTPTLTGGNGYSSSSPGRRMAPGRHHQRTRSLEEWANMFGITGISGGADDIVHDRTDLPKRKKHQRGASGSGNGYFTNGSSNINGSSSSNAFPPIRPPLPPKAPPFGSPSSVNRKQHRRLDSIVESSGEQDHVDDSSDTNADAASEHRQQQQKQLDGSHHSRSSSRRGSHHSHTSHHSQSQSHRRREQEEALDDDDEDEEAPEIYDGGRAAFAAAALGGLVGMSGQQNLSDGSQQSHIVLPNEPYQPPPSPRFLRPPTPPTPRQQQQQPPPGSPSLFPPLPILGQQKQRHHHHHSHQQQHQQYPSPGGTPALSPNDDESNNNNINNYASHESQSVGSNDGSSSLFSIPQQLTSGSGQYSSFSTGDGGVGGGGSGDTIGADDDDSSVDDNSTTLDFSKSQSPASSYHQQQEDGGYNSSNTNDTINNNNYERLAKFEKEQQIMFQQRKSSMERELSNVLERNAVKSHREKQEFINTYIQELEKERAKLVAQWKQEWENAEREEEYLKQIRDPNRRLLRELNRKINTFLDSFLYMMSNVEVFISNMPLTIAALALSWVSMGCVWFKFMEENVDSCSHVHFYSPHCTFPEFPGCFECDVTNRWYIVGVNWHYFCSMVSFTFCSMIILKVIIAWDVVVDELSNPTTSTPCGVFCIAMVCVFAGRGPIGEIVVLITATFHFILAFFFLYRALYKYRLYPDPGWFPNTVGISYAAVKSFLYFPVYGEILMTICLTFFVGVFFISALRVATNPKIAAPICWFMISAPSITLYAVTLIPQPGLSEENAMEHNPELKAHFVNFLQHYFLPLHHFLFGCSLIGVCSAIHGVLSRWEKFKEKPFSPAHVAFVAPTLSHTNAIQAYRGTVAALSSFPPGGKFRTAIYIYWCIFLFTGTIVNFIFTYKFLSRLPEWTKVDISGEHEQPPPPKETMTQEMLDDRGAHEMMLSQPFVSPAVLEANEAGALIRVRRGTEDYKRYGPFIRTRKVTARGFDPSMNDTELREERAALLDWVAKNAPRKRNRTMSIPGVLHLRDQAGRDIYYGSFLGGPSGGGNDSRQPSEQETLGSFYSSADNPSDVSAADRDSGGFISRSSSNSSRRSSRHARSRTSVDGFW